MIGPLLSCKVFGLPEGLSEAYLGLAQRWSGQSFLVPSQDRSVQWDSQTTIAIGGDQWHEEPPCVEFYAHNALIPMGNLNGFQAIAFVSPLPVVAAAFRSAASRYLQRLYDGATTTNFSVNLYHMADDLSNLPPVRGIEGTTPDGFHSVLHAPRRLFPNGFTRIPQMETLHSIELDIGQTATVDGNYGISITDVSVEYSEIVTCLTRLFTTLRKYTSSPTQ